MLTWQCLCQLNRTWGLPVGFVHTDGRCRLSSWAATHTVLCQRDFVLIPLVFLSLREAGSELLLRAVALLHRNTRGQGRGLGTSCLPLTLPKAAVGLPLGEQEGPAGVQPLAGIHCSCSNFLRVLVSSGASFAKGQCPLVSAKNIYSGNRAAMAPLAASVCAHKDRVKVVGTKSF